MANVSQMWGNLPSSRCFQLLPTGITIAWSLFIPSLSSSSIRCQIHTTCVLLSTSLNCHVYITVYIKKEALQITLKFSVDGSGTNGLQYFFSDGLFMSCEQVVNACWMCGTNRLWKACGALEYFNHPGTAFYGRGQTREGHFLCSIHRAAWSSTSMATCDRKKVDGLCVNCFYGYSHAVSVWDWQQY